MSEKQLVAVRCSSRSVKELPCRVCPKTLCHATDLSDDEWKILEPLIPDAKPGGRPRVHETRELLNAIFYVLRGGYALRLLPHDFLPWQSAYHYLRRSRLEKEPGRGSTPPYARGCAACWVGSLPPAQRSSTPKLPRSPRGADCAATMVARRSAVESGICSSIQKEGLVIGVAVHEANISDRDGAKLLLKKVGDRLTRMEKVWADRAYNGKIGEWMKERLGWTLEIVKPPRRWVRVGKSTSR